MRRVEKQTSLDRYKMPSWRKPDFVRSIGSSRLELLTYKDAERRIFATRCPGHTDGSWRDGNRQVCASDTATMVLGGEVLNTQINCAQ